MEIGDNPLKLGHPSRTATIHSGIVQSGLPFTSQYAALGAALVPVFVFVVLASGAMAYQAQSIENCLKLEAFSNGDKVAANIAGEDVPILQGKCRKRYSRIGMQRGHTR